MQNQDQVRIIIEGTDSAHLAVAVNNELRINPDQELGHSRPTIATHTEIPILAISLFMAGTTILIGATAYWIWRQRL